RRGPDDGRTLAAHQRTAARAAPAGAAQGLSAAAPRGARAGPGRGRRRRGARPAPPCARRAAGHPARHRAAGNPMTISRARPLGRSVAFTPPPAPPRAAISAPGVVLEPLDPARHAGPIWEKVAGADWLWDYLGYGPFPDAEAYAEWQRGNALGADPAFYAILDPDRPAEGALGLASFLRIERQHGVIEIGHILMVPQLQKTRTASAAI